MRARILAVLGLAVAGAQGGHMLAYELRFGSAAQQMQASGAHQYFPTLAKTTVGAVALTVLAALLIAGAARIVARGPNARAAGGPSFVGLLATLFTLQLAWFIAQEVTESLVAGVAPPAAADLLLWGMAGQLPVAIACAAVLVWLGRRVEEAIEVLGSVAPARIEFLTSAPVALQLVPVSDALALTHEARSRIVKRGPPISSAFRPF